MKLKLECLICDETKHFETIATTRLDVGLVELVLMIFAFKKLHDKVDVYLDSARVDIDSMECWRRSGP